MPKISKEKRISEEINRISVFFEELDQNKKAIITPLLQNASFMKVTMEDLQEIINKEGAVEAYQNGANQHGMKQSAAVQSYNAIVKNYASVVKTLYSLLPPERKAAVQSYSSWQPREKTAEEIAEARRRDAERIARINAEIDAAAARQREQWRKEGRI